jgi:hypothetical protein
MTDKNDNELRAVPRVMILTAWDLERYNGSRVEPLDGGQFDHSANLSWEITFIKPGDPV